MSLIDTLADMNPLQMVEGAAKAALDKIAPRGKELIKGTYKILSMGGAPDGLAAWEPLSPRSRGERFFMGVHPEVPMLARIEKRVPAALEGMAWSVEGTTLTYSTSEPLIEKNKRIKGRDAMVLSKADEGELQAGTQEEFGKALNRKLLKG